MKNWVKLFVTALIGGALGHLTGIPIGVMLGSLLLVGVIQFKTNQFPQLPFFAKKVVQVIIGGSVGLSFSQETFTLLKGIWSPALILFTFHTIFSLLLALIMYRMLNMDIITALCGTAPAGLSEMVLLAEEYKASLPSVVIMHMFRILLIVTSIPIIIQFIT